MTQPLGMEDFFALEAGEYLARLGSLLAGTARPNGDELVRFARALRGSALMASQHAIARAAGGLEHLVRAYRDGRRSWDDELSGVCGEAVSTMRVLVERVRAWGPDDAARADRLALLLESNAGALAAPPTPHLPTSDAGVRAFVAREAAAMGSTLDQAARALRLSPVGTEAAQAVLRRMQPLRGLAALSDFPPLAELLDGIDATIVALARLEIAPADVAGRFEVAARALARAAREVAERGRPDPESEDFRSFAELLRSAPETEPAIVPIEQLFFTGEEGIVQRGTAPRGLPSPAPSPVSIVSHAERLGELADEIARASSGTQLELRLHTLMTNLRVFPAGLPAGLESAVERFATAARAAIGRGAALAEPQSFAALLRDAGSRLRAASDLVDPAAQAPQIGELAASLDALRAPPGVPAAPAAITAPARAVAPAPRSRAELAEEELPIVPIESLAPDEELEVDLAGSWGRYEELVFAERAPAVAAVAPPPRQAAPTARPAPKPAPPPEPVLETVDIDQLLYRGGAALARAQQVGRELRMALNGGALPESIQPLVEELLDLVALAER
jgi:chemotaxis protein histidine kinase CheA